MSVKLLTEHHLEFLSLKGGWQGSSESTLVKIPHCWKSIINLAYYEILHFFCRLQKNQHFRKLLSGIPSEGQAVGKSYQQAKLVGN